MATVLVEHPGDILTDADGQWAHGQEDGGRVALACSTTTSAAAHVGSPRRPREAMPGDQPGPSTFGVAPHVPIAISRHQQPPLVTALNCGSVWGRLVASAT
jgi:hypothetical protein